ncbi:homeobox-leucine zipper protein HAT4-like [Asparagus officinalis]|uniref:homeobox-leucine zipper protein HAT4-like n=1 Tax=Asparagus officinalis TaxID=4686 RepID=UPI00098E049E|nr:homeobox-leucine zipper protein HAT4-like [Asparagus officinalis]
MAAGSEDLRLSLSLSSSENFFPLNLTLSPPSTSPSKAINGETEEEAEAWSPVSTLSSLSGKRRERDDNEVEEDGQNSFKKLRLSKEQTTVLEESFKEHNTLNPKQKQGLATQLNLRPRQVEVWFQNRRARTKLKQTGEECEYLKKWCQKLAEENSRLQKEVGELRALKSVSSNSPTPPTASPPPLLI